MAAAIDNQFQFLQDQVTRCDFAAEFRISKIIESTICVAKLRELLYVKSLGSESELLRNPVKFVRAGAGWGNKQLESGQTALVFLRWNAGKLTEYPWRGHLVIEKINGVQCGLFQWPELWNHAELPTLIRENSMPAPGQSGMTAIKYDALKHYLKENF